MTRKRELQILANRIETLEERVRKLEQQLNGRTSTFQHTTRVLWRNPEPKPDASASPFVSKAVHLSERLTSFEFAVKATAAQAAITGVVATLLSSAGALIWDWPWQTPPVVGVSVTTLSWMLLVLDHRDLLHQTVAAARRRRRPEELRITVQTPQKGRIAGSDVERLFIKANITTEQIKQFARAVTSGESLTVHNWVGAGSLFTRGQYDSLMSELERMGYVLPGAGNKPRRPTAKGRALLRALAQ